MYTALKSLCICLGPESKPMHTAGFMCSWFKLQWLGISLDSAFKTRAKYWPCSVHAFFFVSEMRYFIFVKIVGDLYVS